MQFSESIFAARFNITKQDLQKYLSEALSQAGDYADLYFEYLLTSSISIDESMVKSAAQGVSMGVGIRVIAGERTGYAYSDDLSPEKILKAARVAAYIAAGPSKISPFVIPKMIANAASGNVSIHFGLCGPNTAVSTACGRSE